ncbi:MAG TPA: hypothetical protein VEC01_09685 [Noviherbaspirillum sp.]|uniref:hypothetical protein n=1 Tax=Noviherbaspirillum sp. TaxID=1926288 RepID=UPI002D38BA73|nr:hypothetical protein [Noviherbaspirillum sp.]HYD95582.1 hypothetical protein [Noviherbaspirillum sp.]
MKSLPLVIATLAIPSSVAFAQTPPATTPSASAVPYIPLFGNNANTGTGTGTSGTAGASTWFIDVTNRLVVLCTQPANGTGGAAAGTQNFTCTAQPIPTAATPGAAPGATPGAATGATPGATAGATPGATTPTPTPPAGTDAAGTGATGAPGAMPAS